MKTKVELVKDLITGLSLTDVECLELMKFISAQGSLSFSLLSEEIKTELSEIKAGILRNEDMISLLKSDSQAHSVNKTESVEIAESTSANQNSEVPVITFEGPSENSFAESEKTQIDFHAKAETKSGGEDMIKLLPPKRKEKEKAEVSENKTKKSYYVPTGRKRGRPRKNQSIEDMPSPFDLSKTIVVENKPKPNTAEESVTIDPDLQEAISAFEEISELRGSKTESLNESIKPEALDCEKETASETEYAAEIKLETSAAESNESSVDDEEEQPNLTKKERVRAAKRTNALPGEKDLENLKMGGILSLNLLYETKDGVVQSENMMNSILPLGVCLRYKYSHNVFAVYPYEMTSMTLKDAQNYAKTLPKVNGNSWMVLTPQQRDACKSKKNELNIILKKVGGDVFNGDYLTNPLTYGCKTQEILKVRFAVEL